MNKSEKNNFSLWILKSLYASFAIFFIYLSGLCLNQITKLTYKPLYFIPAFL